jgi:predicted membrane-bound spermidine synthase
MIRPIALLLTVLTGFSGLVYQVAWQKYLAILLGSHSEAVAAVLAIFLGGLAAGYALFGRVTRRQVERARARGESPALLRLYGLVESGIGVYALLFPVLFSLAQALSVRIPHLGEGLAFAIDVCLTLLLIAPPTVLMGGTIPVLTQALASRLEEATRVHAWVYSFNTAGAFFGALAGAFLLIPLLGLDGVLRAMGLVNLLAGVSFLALQRRARPAALGPQAEAPSRQPERFGGYAAVVLLAGFAMMCVQTILNRIGALSLGASHFTFAMVVAVFVLCIALGSLAVSALRRIPPLLIVGSQWLLVALLGLLYFQIENTPYYAHVIRILFANLAAGFYPYHFLVFLGLLAVLLVPIGLSGALLPLVFHHLRNEMGELGGVAGRLYAWNTLGSLLGALLGGYALLFFVDLHHVFAIALGGLALGAGILTVLVLRLPALPVAAATAAALGGCLLLPAWEPLRMSAGLFRQRTPLPQSFAGPEALFQSRGVGSTLEFHDDDPTSTIVVLGGNSLSLMNNGKSDGNLRYDYTTMSMAGLLPALLTDDPARAFVVGWGMGITAGVLGALDDVQEVIAAEISPAVLEAAPLFDEGTRDATGNPKVHAIRSDAYRALLRSEGRFGVISSEPSSLWATGSELIFSQEFLTAARDRLTPGGVFAQWIHLYEVDDETVDIVMRTYKQVFGDMAIWFTRGPDVLLLGFRDPSPRFDLGRLRQRFERPDFRQGFERAQIGSWIQLLAHEALPLGAVAASPLPGPLHTVRHPILTDRAARAFFAGGRIPVARLPSEAANQGAARGSLLRLEIGDGEPSEEMFQELAQHACAMGQAIDCTVLVARWITGHPGSARAAAAAREIQAADYLGEKTIPLSAAAIEAVAQLYRGRLVESTETPGPLANAVATSHFFATYFHHAFPFDRAPLRRVWTDCASDQRAVLACTAERRKVEQKLGPTWPKQTAAR